MRLGRTRKVPDLGAVFDTDVPRRGRQRPDQRGTLAEMITGGRGRRAQRHVRASLVAQRAYTPVGKR